MRDSYHNSFWEQALNWMIMPFWIVGTIIWTILKLLWRLISDVFKSFYGKVVAFLGALAFLYFVAYISGLIK